MFILGNLVLVLLGALLGAVVGSRFERDDVAIAPGLTGEHRRRIVRWVWAAVVVGGAVAFGVAMRDPLGRGLLLAAPLFGLVVLMAAVAAERSVAAPATTERRAGLGARSISNYLPRPLTGVVAGSAGILAVITLATTLAASPDDLGRAGRWITVACSAALTQSQGPWPGSFYTAPLLAVGLVGIATALLGLASLVARPRLGEFSNEGVGMDDALRRRSARVIVGASGVFVAMPLLGIATVAASALSGLECLPAAGSLVKWALIGIVPLAAVLLGWSTRALLSAVLPPANHEAAL